MKRVSPLFLRRAFFQLTRSRFATNQPDYEAKTEVAQSSTSPRRVILPSTFMHFLNEFDEEKPPTSEVLARLLPEELNYKTSFVINQVLVKNSAVTTVALVNFFHERGRLDEKSVISAGRALARAWIQEPFDEKTRDLCAKLYSLLPDHTIGRDVRLLLDLCLDKWPVAVDNATDVLVLKGDVFNALVIGCLRNSDIKQLGLFLKMFRSLFLHSDPHVFRAFCRSISSGNQSLVRAYLQHLDGRVITEEVLENIKEVVRSSKSARLRSTRETYGKCRNCGANLVQRRLDSDEFERLGSEVTAFIKNVCISGQKGSLVEFEVLKRLTNQMSQKTNDRPAVVVDLLNLQRGRTDIALDGLIHSIHDLKKKYGNVLLIGRHNVLKDQQVQMQEKGIQFFTCHKHSSDDMFAICAALWLGPNTVLMSNDRFTDFLCDLQESTDVADLFSIWTMNRTVGFTTDFTILELTNFSNLLHYSPQTRTCHFTVLSKKYTANRKSYCLTY